MDGSIEVPMQNKERKDTWHELSREDFLKAKGALEKAHVPGPYYFLNGKLGSNRTEKLADAISSVFATTLPAHLNKRTSDA